MRSASICIFTWHIDFLTIQPHKEKNKSFNIHYSSTETKLVFSQEDLLLSVFEMRCICLFVSRYIWYTSDTRGRINTRDLRTLNISHTKINYDKWYKSLEY